LKYSFEKLRQKHSLLAYQGFDYLLTKNSVEVTYDFLLEPDISFAPKVILPVIKKNVSIPHLENLLFNLGIIESISYWKLACPRELRIEAGSLSEKQIEWWKDLFLQGLGEFYFINEIDCSDDSLIHITSTSDKSWIPNKKLEVEKDHPLILVGGGKDSALTLEILKGKKELSCFLLNPQKSYLETAKAVGCVKNILTAKRTIDPKLIEMNSKGYLNGHTPFSAYLAFLSTTVASLNGFDQILSSNESSANEENTIYKGLAINHQYSKSFDFEKKFRSYQSEFLKTKTSYISFLRPLHEIQIAALFARHKNQHPVFRSCNRDQKENKWCASCPKCAFVFLMLYSFLPHEEILNIFGSDYFLDEKIQKFLEENIDPSKIKPLECVGSRKEALLALKLSISKRKKENIKTPSKLQALLLLKENNRLLNDWNPEHHLDSELESILKAEVEKIVSSPVLIYGYGKEGQSTHKFLKERFPYLDIQICDKNLSNQNNDSLNCISEKQFLEQKIAHKILFRSPGISLHNPLIKKAKKEGLKVSSLANIFFENVSGKTIGVTGTKGKSTTSSLIAHLLKTKYKDIRLVGNIGNPALDALENSNSDTIFIFELSSFQLEDLNHSPETAVLLSIYPEHLDHHGSIEEYKESKQKIYKTSKTLIIAEKNKDLIKQNYNEETIFFTNKQYSLPELRIHQDNLLAAVTVAEKYGINTNDIQKGLNSFEPLPHRMQHIGTFSEITFINDSLSTMIH